MKIQNPIIKNTATIFVRNLIYIFIPMGIMYLFLLIGIVFFFSEFMSVLSDTLSALGTLIHSSAQQSPTMINDFLSYMLGKLQWNGDFGDLFSQISDSAWIEETLRGFFSILNDTSVEFEEEFSVIVKDFIQSLVIIASVTVAIWSLGLVFANFATGYVIRRKTVKRGLRKFIIAHTLSPLLQAVILLGAVILLSLIKLYGILLFAAILLLFSGLSLVDAWMIHREKCLPLKEIVTPKNLVFQLAAGSMILLFDLVLALLLLLLGAPLALLIMIPVMIYSLKIIDISAETFVLLKLDEIKASE